MKRIIFLIILILIFALSGCQAIMTSVDADGGYAEIIMPDGTIIDAQYDSVVRPGTGWIKVHINGEWYAMHETRLVLHEKG
jgi:uncharacterized protein YceK